MSNVIDITGRLKSLNSSGNQSSQEAATIVDIGAARSQMISDDRRQVKRTILTEFISVHAVVPERGIMRVSLYDITENGLSFDLEMDKGHYNIGDLVELRVYLNFQTYFKIETKVMHIREALDEGVVRHGCGFVNGSSNNEAVTHFVQFLESVTASLRRDGGDVQVSKINS